VLKSSFGIATFCSTSHINEGICMNKESRNLPTIIFDFAGVLIAWEPRKLFRQFFPNDPAGMERFLEEVDFYNWNAQFDWGFPIAQGVAELSQRFPAYSYLIHAYEDLWEQSLVGAIEPTVAILQDLKQAGYPLYGLSNWSAEKFYQVCDHYPFFDWFDDKVISGEVKLAKPDPRIFELILSKIGQPAEECLFIDDTLENIVAARSMGFQAIHFESPEQLRAELYRRGYTICESSAAMTSASSNYFEQVAGRWDSLRSAYFTEVVRCAALEKAHLRPEMTVADVGAGTGFMAAGLAPLVEKVIVLDGSQAMLDVARKNLAEFKNVEYHQADGLSLPLLDESVDAAFANMYLHHCVDPLAAIREMARSLKPGGCLVITDMDAHNHTWMKAEMADVWLGFERRQVERWFQQAGLVDVSLDCTGQSCRAESGNPAITDEKDRSAEISVFIAVGDR
jgi:HAD superfamily hydrolase (TIGR01509 family)